MFPVVIVCDDSWMGSNAAWRRALGRLWTPRGVRVPAINEDIEPGAYRPVDYSRPPFQELGGSWVRASLTSRLRFLGASPADHLVLGRPARRHLMAGHCSREY